MNNFLFCYLFLLFLDLLTFIVNIFIYPVSILFRAFSTWTSASGCFWSFYYFNLLENNFFVFCFAKMAFHSFIKSKELLCMVNAISTTTSYLVTLQGSIVYLWLRVCVEHYFNTNISSARLFKIYIEEF